MLPDEVRLAHISSAANAALRFVDGRDRTDLDSDEMLTLALTKLIEIVGEAAKNTSPETQAKYPDVAWRSAARMRDRLVHHYFDINKDALWATVQEDLPVLLRGLGLSAGPSDASNQSE